MRNWWRERGNAARFDLYTRISCYANFAVAPPLLGFLIAPRAGAAAAWVAALLAAAFAGVCAQLVHRGIAHYLGRGDQPVRLIAFTTLLAAAAAAGGHLVGRGDTIALFAVAIYLAALTTAARPRTTLLLWVIIVSTTTVVVPDAGVRYALLLAALAGAYRLALWMLGLVWELDGARRLEGRVAVAEERLRFARDLHDVVGRNLSVVALKAELAAQLSKRGRAEAVTEMLEVRGIAQDSLAELRAVVSGYRSADLAAELAGARSLLTSAGIGCRVIGNADDLPAHVQGTFAWVVREGTTNVLRHSDAQECTITVRPAEGAMTLTMDNDGVPAATVRHGNGLTGLSERITAFGGEMTAAHRSSQSFRLTVTLPLAEELS